MLRTFIQCLFTVTDLYVNPMFIYCDSSFMYNQCLFTMTIILCTFSVNLL